MKLLLTSLGWVKDPAIGREFLKLVGKEAQEIKILLVLTPKKYLDRKRILSFFCSIGNVKILEKNINFFKFDRQAKTEDFKNIDVVFVFGGNTFEYLDGIRKTGLDKLLRKFVKSGGVYLGVSAGSYVACPSIEAAGWKHSDKNIVGLKKLKGLNLVPFLISVHFERKWQKVVSESAKSAKWPTVVLSDKQAVLISGGTKKIIGKGKKMVINSEGNIF